MLELLDFDRVHEIVILIVPGFVSLRVWTLINPTARLRLSHYVLDVVVYSVLNFAALSWLIVIVEDRALLIRVLTWAVVLVIAPGAWPLLLRALLQRRFLRGRIVHPIPLAWDHFFGKGRHCFVLVHLKNGNLIGGLYSRDSFASSYPERQEIYLSEVWRVDGRGRFQSRVDATRGVLVSHDVIEYLEFYDAGQKSSEATQAAAVTAGHRFESRERHG